MPDTYRLLRLEPAQVGDFWHLVKVGLTEGLAGADKSAVRDQNILEQLMIGGMQCWFLLSHRGPEAMAVTQIYEDAMTKDKVFYIYSVYSYPGNAVPIEEWVRTFKGVCEFAKAQGCTRVISYTNEDRVKEIYEAVGGTERYSFMVYDLRGGQLNETRNGKAHIQQPKEGS